MSTLAQEQQLQQELQNELTVSNQLIRLISIELQHIKSITNPGGDLESNLIQNATLTEKLAKIQQINLENLPAIERTQMNLSHN